MQVPISLSTGESEYHSTDGGFLRLWFDASAEKGIASRRGVGEIKCLRIEVLRLQQAVTTSPLSVHKILGDVNAADLGTKHFLVAARIIDLLWRIGHYRKSGRSATALQASTNG